MADNPSPHPPLFDFFRWFGEHWPLAITIFAISFSVSVVYLYLIRQKETSHREPWRNIMFVFFISATLSVLLAFILNYYIVINVFYDMILDGNNNPYDLTPNWGDVLSASLMAPVTEEPAKLLPVVMFYYLTTRIPAFQEYFKEPSRAKQGIVLGIAAGLGFATNENVLYVLRVYYLFGGHFQYGVMGATSTFIIRSFSSSLLHAAATGFSGYGFIKYKLEGDRVFFFKMLGFAMLLHGFYNFMASVNPFLGFSVVLILSVFMITYIAEKIYYEEVRTGEYVPPKTKISVAYLVDHPLRTGRPPTEDGFGTTNPYERATKMSSNICPHCKKFMGRLDYCVFCGYKGKL